MSSDFVPSLVFAMHPELRVLLELIGQHTEVSYLKEYGGGPHVYDEDGEADPNLITNFPRCLRAQEVSSWVQHLSQCPRCAWLLFSEVSSLADMMPEDYDLDSPAMVPFLDAIRTGLGIQVGVGSSE